MAERQSPEEERVSKDAPQTDLIFADCPNGWRSLTYVQYPGKSDSKRKRAKFYTLELAMAYQRYEIST